MNDEVPPTAPPPRQPLLPTAHRLLQEAQPGVLYHYTDPKGYLGILERGSLWATAIRFLNDTREYDVGLQRIQAELAARGGKDPVLAGLLEGALDVAPWNAPTVGVASFSEVRDDLSQWRAYSGGSGGFAVGFDGHRLMREINRDFGVLVPVVYGDAEHSTAHDEAVSAICDDVISGAQSLADDPVERQAFRRRCNMSVQVVCSLLKDSAFRAEREWRAIIMGPAGIRSTLRVRQGRSTLVPYYDVSIRDESLAVDRLPLHEVVVGPTPHPQQALLAASTALGINDEQRTRVMLSDVPFRDW